MLKKLLPLFLEKAFHLLWLEILLEEDNKIVRLLRKQKVRDTINAFLYQWQEFDKDRGKSK